MSADLTAEDQVEIDALAIEPGTDPVAGDGSSGTFNVRLDNFEGPFDLLLSLISRRQLDVTEVALSQVTDEFIAHIADAGFDLEQVTEFLVVAATLLDLKTARLLPAADVEDEDDLALLEARDLLFARLLQYRAYKLAAAYLGELAAKAGRRYGRTAELEPPFAELMPEVFLSVSPAQLAALATIALAPKPVPTVDTDHIHTPKVSVREQMRILRERLHRSGAASFRSLVADCTSTAEVVGRFLALLELYRDHVIAFDQATALGELQVRWAGGDGTGSADHADSAASVDEEYS